MEMQLFPLPLPSAPPSGYGYSSCPPSTLSATTAFGTGINERDVFLGDRRCVICGLGDGPVLQHVHIIPVSELETWLDLRERHWIPNQAKKSPRHEPRDGMLMCANHRLWFEGYRFFIRYFPETHRFVFINYSGRPALQKFHGKSIGLDIKECHAPFPSLFIIHEMRVRGFHPFQPTNPTIPVGNPWQDWILSGGVLNDDPHLFHFKRQNDEDQTAPAEALPQLQTTRAGGASSGELSLTLDTDVIANILAATRAMPSWKACVMEGTSWTGTAEENTQKYISSLGLH